MKLETANCLLDNQSRYPSICPLNLSLSSFLSTSSQSLTRPGQPSQFILTTPSFSHSGHKISRIFHNLRLQIARFLVVFQLWYLGSQERRQRRGGAEQRVHEHGQAALNGEGRRSGRQPSPDHRQRFAQQLQIGGRV